MLETHGKMHNSRIQGLLLADGMPLVSAAGTGVAAIALCTISKQRTQQHCIVPPLLCKARYIRVDHCGRCFAE